MRELRVGDENLLHRLPPPCAHYHLLPPPCAHYTTACLFPVPCVAAGQLVILLVLIFYPCVFCYLMCCLGCCVGGGDNDDGIKGMLGLSGWALQYPLSGASACLAGHYSIP